jgi:S1-C subfamily serine protease
VKEQLAAAGRKQQARTNWMVAAKYGAKVRNIVGLDEVSAAGTPGETGVIVLDVPAAGPAGAAGITANDVILGFNNKPVKDTQDLLRLSREAGRGSRANITIMRYQQTSTVSIALN